MEVCIWKLKISLVSKARIFLSHKAPRKMHLKMSSAEAVCCKLLPNITDELSIEANSADPEQTADLGPHCLPYRLLNISADKKASRRLLLRLAY